MGQILRYTARKAVSNDLTTDRPAWTGMTNIATYALLPQATVDHFIARGAVVFQRPGWVLVDRAHPEDWLSRFRAAYEITEEKQFGGFTAYRLVPR
jgi:hypothetical protein